MSTTFNASGPRPRWDDAAARGRSITALVIDSDATRRANLATAMREICTRIDEVDSEELALSTTGRSRHDLIVVAAELSFASGLLVVQRLRRVVGSAILVVTAEHSAVTVVTALEAGADDCCTADNHREMVLRAEMALSRRRSLTVAPIAHGESNDSRYRVDPATRRVVLNGVDVALTTKEFEILSVLAETPGKVFTRTELLERVWNSRPDWQSVDTVTEHVYRIRQKLKASAAVGEWIQTVRGAGYRFSPPLTDGENIVAASQTPPES